MIPGEENKGTAGNQGAGNSGGSPPGSTGSNTGSMGSSPASNQGSPPAAAPTPPFEEPKVIQAVVDPKTKQKEGPAAFSFTKPQAIHQQYAEPSKGDAEKKDKPVDNRSDEQKLADIRAEIAQDEKSDKTRSYSDYHDTAEMFILGWEATLMFFGRLISKDTSDTAYGFSEKTREKLIYQATKVSVKRNIVMPIEYMFAGTIIPATGAVLLKAKDKRNEYFKNNPDKSKPLEVNKGGLNKGMVKTRGRGRPRVG